jgi:hypothetical protein
MITGDKFTLIMSNASFLRYLISSVQNPYE